MTQKILPHTTPIPAPQKPQTAAITFPQPLKFDFYHDDNPLRYRKKKDLKKYIDKYNAEHQDKFMVPDVQEYDMIDWLYENPHLVDTMNMVNKQVLGKRRDKYMHKISMNERKIRKVHRYYDEKVPTGISLERYKQIFAQQKRRFGDVLLNSYRYTHYATS
jgi:hypothetical protein